MKQALLRFALVCLAFAGTLAFLFMPRHGQDAKTEEYIDRIVQGGQIHHVGVQYEASYNYQGTDGRAATLVIVVPSSDLDMPDGYSQDHVEQQIYEAVERHATDNGIPLPADYQSQVEIEEFLR